ncbi:neuropeptide FF receptor 1-like [Porites lutea]|uniref:neuropeptide FF receptor 1-like n=1 Tax=Porites lutea TaxID=51062 RepID=UPI003CC5E0E9
MSDTADVAITTSIVILIITCIVGNFFVCVAVMKNREMRIPINYLLVNLAAADICYVTFTIPTIILSHNVGHPNGIFGTFLCAVITGRSFAWIGGLASMLVIAFERYFAVVHPYGNRGKLPLQGLKVIIPGIWILALMDKIPLFMKRSRFVEEDSSIPFIFLLSKESLRKYRTVYLSIDCLVMILLVLIYSRIVYTLWFKQSDNAVLTNQGVFRLRMRVTLIVVTVSAILVISWGADVILHLLEEHATDSVKLSPLAIPIAHTMLMFNSAINPFAYALLNQRFRKKMRQMIRSRSFATRVGAMSVRQGDHRTTGSIPMTQQAN